MLTPMRTTELTDEQWLRLEPLLPPPRQGRGRPRADNRKEVASMRRTKAVLAAATLMVAMLVAFAAPAMANTNERNVQNRISNDDCCEWFDNNHDDDCCNRWWSDDDIVIVDENDCCEDE